MLWPLLSRDAGPGWERQTGVLDKPANRHGTSRMTEASAPARTTASRIIFLNRFFYPDHSATSQILTDLAFHLAGCGTDVRVVTSRQRYDAANALLPEAESIGGVAIHRVSTTRFGRAALIGRGFDYLCFY